MKELKPIRRKGPFFFFTKRKDDKKHPFYNYLNKLLRSLPGYRLITDSSQGINYGPRTGNLYAIITQKRKRKYVAKHVSLLYEPFKKNVTVTFFRGMINKKLFPYSIDSTLVEIIPVERADSSSIKEKIVDWFAKDMMGLRIDITFQTEFPMFSYKNTFYDLSIGSSLAAQIVEDIFKKQINTTNIWELKRFRDEYSAKQMLLYNMVTCKIIETDSEKEDQQRANLFASEICNKLWERISIKVGPIRRNVEFRTPEPVEELYMAMPEEVTDGLKTSQSSPKWPKQLAIAGLILFFVICFISDNTRYLEFLGVTVQSAQIFFTIALIIISLIMMAIGCLRWKIGQKTY